MKWIPIDKFDDPATLEETEGMNVSGGAIVKVTSTEKCKMGNNTTIGLVFVPGLSVSEPAPPSVPDAGIVHPDLPSLTFAARAQAAKEEEAARVQALADEAAAEEAAKAAAQAARDAANAPTPAPVEEVPTDPEPEPEATDENTAPDPDPAAAE